MQYLYIILHDALRYSIRYQNNSPVNIALLEKNISPNQDRYKPWHCQNYHVICFIRAVTLDRLFPTKQQNNDPRNQTSNKDHKLRKNLKATLLRQKMLLKMRNCINALSDTNEWYESFTTLCPT